MTVLEAAALGAYCAVSAASIALLGENEAILAPVALHIVSSAALGFVFGVWAAIAAAALPTLLAATMGTVRYGTDGLPVVALEAPLTFVWAAAIAAGVGCRRTLLNRAS